MELNKKFINLVGLSCLNIAITMFVFGKKLNIPKTIRDNVYFYAFCAGIIILCTFRSWIIDEETKVFFDITAIYYAYLLIMFAFSNLIADFNLYPIYLITTGFILCYFLLLLRLQSLQIASD